VCHGEHAAQAPGVGGFPAVPHDDDDDDDRYDGGGDDDDVSGGGGGGGGGGGSAAPGEPDAPSTPVHSEPSEPSPVHTPREEPPPPSSQLAETSNAGPSKVETRGKATKVEKATVALETQHQARVTRSKTASASAPAATSSRSSVKEGTKSGPSAVGANASRKVGAQVRVERAKRA
jgi:hypothetical protein